MVFQAALLGDRFVTHAADAFAEAHRVRPGRDQLAVLVWQPAQITLGEFPDFAERRQRARHDLALEDDWLQEPLTALRAGLIGELDDVRREITEAVHLFDARPGALVASHLDLGVPTTLVDAVHRLVDTTERRALDVALDGASADAQAGANPERIDRRARVQQLADRELIEVARCRDLYLFQAGAVERRANVARVAGQVAAVEPDRGQHMAEPITRQVRALPRGTNCCARIVRVQQQGVAI